MLSMFCLVRNLPVSTWCHKSGYVNALSTLVQKQTISTSKTGSSKTTKTSAIKAKTSGQSDVTNISTFAENNIRGPPRSNKRFEWTDEKDALLREGIAKHKNGWEKVAEFLGGDVTYQQCYRRAAFLEGVAKEGVKRGAWDQDEVRRLEELVPQYLVHSHWSPQSKKMTDEYTNWKGVGKETGRLASDCSSKWRNLQCGKLKKGHFTAEEDALIRQRVAEWKGAGNGLWIALEREMGRASNVVYSRWSTISSKLQRTDSAMYWTDELDKRLKEGVSLYKHEGWAKVAEYVGGGVTAKQCTDRWCCYVCAMQHGNVKRGAWDHDEVERLAELVPQHLVPSYWSVQYKRMTKEYTDWTIVALTLGRLPADCKVKWHTLRNATLKKGPFTDSEVAIIRERVAGWDASNRRGLWVGLQKDLGRPLVTIRSHWVNVLSKDAE